MSQTKIPITVSLVSFIQRPIKDTLAPPTCDHTHLKYRVVVYGGEIETEVDPVQPSVSEVISGALVDVPLSLALPIVRQPVHLQTKRYMKVSYEPPHSGCICDRTFL